MNQNTDRRIRVALLDDHPVVLHGLSARLEGTPDIVVVGEFAIGRELLAALSVQEIDVLLMDYSLGPNDIDGLGLLRMLRSRYPALEILVMSGHGHPATAALAIRAGARGFISKMRPIGEWLEAIRSVATGMRYVDQSMAHTLAQAIKRMPHAEECGQTATLAEQSSLSPREQEVLRCVLDGMAVTTIAKKFSRSVNTISTQKQAAYRKLGIRSDAELFKIQHGLTETRQ
jgi:two-component system, NarL family, captular synthesis response regulator RcsB